MEWRQLIASKKQEKKSKMSKNQWHIVPNQNNLQPASIIIISLFVPIIKHRPFEFEACWCRR